MSTVSSTCSACQVRHPRCYLPLILILLLSHHAWFLRADTLHVRPYGCKDPDGTLIHPFCNLGEAVAHASRGDTIVIHQGVYRAPVTVRKQLFIRSYRGEDNVYLGTVVPPVACSEPPQFTTATLTDEAVKSVSISLYTATRPVDQWLKGVLTPSTLSALDLYRRTLTGLSTAARSLADELTTIRNGPSIYDSERFAGVELTEYIRQLLAQKPYGVCRQTLNVELLYRAYPALADPDGPKCKDSGIISVTAPDDFTCDRNEPVTVTAIFAGISDKVPTVKWTVEGGAPDDVSVAKPDQLITDVTFKTPGLYRLRITALVNTCIYYDEVNITVTGIPPCRWTLQSIPLITLPTPETAEICTTALYACSPAPPMIAHWSCVDNCDGVEFLEERVTGTGPFKVCTKVRFLAPGYYKLRLTVGGDQEASRVAEFVRVMVSEVTCTKPTVEITSPKSIKLQLPDACVTIKGRVSDNCPDSPSPTQEWKVIKQPEWSNVTFSSPAADTTIACFDSVGDYLIALEATDPAVPERSADTMRVSVWSGPSCGPQCPRARGTVWYVKGLRLEVAKFARVQAVRDNLVYASEIADYEGRYELPLLPCGSYTIRARYKGDVGTCEGVVYRSPCDPRGDAVCNINIMQGSEPDVSRQLADDGTHAPRLFTPVVGQDGSVLLYFSGVYGTAYRVESSTDLVQWNPGRAVICAGLLSYVELEISVEDAARYYRLVVAE